VERSVYLICAVAVAGAALRVAALLSGTGADTAGDTTERDRQMIMTGGYLSWQVTDGCAQGPVECSRVLREANVGGRAYGVRVMSDGSLIGRDDDPGAVTVSVSELPAGDCWWEVKADGSTEPLCK
jgi:hypothetical protein